MVPLNMVPLNVVNPLPKRLPISSVLLVLSRKPLKLIVPSVCTNEPKPLVVESKFKFRVVFAASITPPVLAKSSGSTVMVPALTCKLP